MMPHLNVQLVVENVAKGQGMLAEHGLAYCLNVDGHQVLFDTGQGLPNVLQNNADRLGINLDQTELIVLSHGHYDHTGAMPSVLEQAPAAKLHAHPAALEAKFSPEKQDRVRSIGMPEASRNAMERWQGTCILNSEPLELLPGLFLTGEIPRTTDFEDTGGQFYLDQALTIQDPLLDDQALFFESNAGTVVILGCAHSGVINTLIYIEKLTDNRPIHAVIGGMHLGSASKQRIDKTIAAMKKWSPAIITPLHCTGMPATVAFHNAFPDALRATLF